MVIVGLKSLGIYDDEALESRSKQIIEFLNLMKSVFNLINNSVYFDTKKLYSELKLNPELNNYPTFKGTRCPANKIYHLFERKNLKDTVEKCIKEIFKQILLYLKDGRHRLLVKIISTVEEILSCLEVFRINQYFKDNKFGDLMIIFVDGLMDILENNDKTDINFGKVITDSVSRETTGNDKHQRKIHSMCKLKKDFY